MHKVNFKQAVSTHFMLNDSKYLARVSALHIECHELIANAVHPDQLVHISAQLKDINLIHRAFPTMPEAFKIMLYEGKLRITNENDIWELIEIDSNEYQEVN